MSYSTRGLIAGAVDQTFYTYHLNLARAFRMGCVERSRNSLGLIAGR